MKKLLVLISALLFVPGVMAASENDIIEAVKSKAKQDFFPKDVKVESISDVRFFPTAEDTSYARFGNVCGKASISKEDKSSSLVFIVHIVEKSNQLHVDVPTLYDLDKQDEVARSDLQVRCE